MAKRLSVCLAGLWLAAHCGWGCPIPTATVAPTTVCVGAVSEVMAGYIPGDCPPVGNPWISALRVNTNSLNPPAGGAIDLPFATVTWTNTGYAWLEAESSVRYQGDGGPIKTNISTNYFFFTVLKMDIEQTETNICWKTTNVVLNLTADSFWDESEGGSVVWTSAPAGLGGVGFNNTNFWFNPSNSAPTAYMVRAWSSLLTNCQDVCTTRVWRVEIAPSNAFVCWQTNSFTFSLTNSYWGGSSVIWTSAPAGLSPGGASGATFEINPSNSVLTNYTITACIADQTNCYATAALTVLKVEFKELWETSNRVNQVFNPTPKDDPPATLSNRLYTVECPSDDQYHVTLDVNDQPASIRSKLMWVVYDGGTKLAESNFPASGPANIVFNHPTAKQDDLTDFELKCGLDINGNNSLESSEVLCPLNVTNTAGQVIGPPMVKGASTIKYADSVSYIENIFLVPFVLPHAKSLLHIFLDGNTSSLDADKQPSQTNTVNFNCYTDPFSVWLTHNAGASFNAAGTTQIQYYTWGTNTSLADKTCKYYQPKNAAQGYYQTNVLPIANAFFATNPVGTITNFPLDGSAYDIPHSNESPAWVDAYLSGVTVTFDDPDIDWYLDDIGGTIGRGRVLSHTAIYTIEKKVDVWGTPYLELICARFAGVVEDLYDFNAEDQGAGGKAAIIELGHGNGSYGAGRSSGVIFRDRIEFNQSVDNPFE